MELCLLLETSLAGVAVDLVDLSKSDSAGRLWTVRYPHAGQSTVKLLDMVTQGLETLQKSPQDIEKILVSHGPGSFTGIKIGLAWVYGWKAACPQVLLGETSGLESAFLAWEASHSSQTPLALCLPSTRTHGFICLRQGDELVTRLIDLTQEDALPFRDSPNPWHIISCGPWALLKELCGSPIEWEISDLLDLSLRGMHIQAKSLDWQTDTLPMPRFLRQPTVVEKMEQTEQTKVHS